MKLTCLVDDAVQPDTGFWGEHGLAYLIEADGQRVLFDTGQSGTVLLHNLKLLDIDPATFDALAISHSHYDHTGGLPALMPYLRPGIPLFANADLFRQRFAQRAGPPKFIGSELSRDELTARLTLKLSADPQEIVPGVWTTGEINERTEFEGRGKELLMAVGGELVADAYRDDMALVLRSDDHLGLLCGCCHAGLLNALAHVARLFPEPVALDYRRSAPGRRGRGRLASRLRQAGSYAGAATRLSRPLLRRSSLPCPGAVVGTGGGADRPGRNGD